jgi:regulator of replication initiation timing
MESFINSFHDEINSHMEEIKILAMELERLEYAYEDLRKPNPTVIYMDQEHIKQEFIKIDKKMNDLHREISDIKREMTIIISEIIV